MDYHSGAVVGEILGHIMREFKVKLREREVQQAIPQVLTQSVARIMQELIQAGEMPKPKQYHDLVEEFNPVNIQVDVNANFSLESIVEPHGPVFSETASGLSVQTSDVVKVKRTRKSISRQFDNAQTEKGVFALS